MADNISNLSSVSAANYLRSTTQTQSQKSGINMQDFLTLIVAQMKNQDMNSSQNNGEFMAQMAQMASMQAMQEMSSVFKSSMAVNYVGKFVQAEATVAITETDELTGKEFVSGYQRVSRSGTVSRVGFDKGDTMVLIDNVWFKLEDIFEVHEKAPSEASNTQNKTE